jgi:primosomal protein N' (replication factor Y) (superfamily II helicase)
MKDLHTSFHSPRRLGVLPSRPVANIFDYAVPDGLDLALGDIVKVPLAGAETPGVVWSMDSDGKVADNRMKAVIERKSTPPLSETLRSFVDWVAEYTLSSPGAVLRMVLSVPDALDPPKPVFSYVANSPAPEDLRMTPSRKKVLDVLEGGKPLRPAVLAKKAGVSSGVVRAMIKAKALVAVTGDVTDETTKFDLETPGPVLSSDQASAASDLCDKIKADAFSVSLLDGVPGSGKTEVYFEAIAETLKRGREVLVLLPEISLGAQWLARFEERFAAKPLAWHSDLSKGLRRKTWRTVANGGAQVVVGARSALFLPFSNLGLIVVDEEHDASFKQEEGVIYNARDMAVVRARLGNFPIVLASATPSLETMANVDRGRYQRLLLPDRHAGASLAPIECIDLRRDPPPRGGWISPLLADAIKETLEKGEQAFLFLNRRGYAPLTLCRSCGHRMQCPRCTAWLVEHRRLGRLLCHHCGHTAVLPKVCPSCESENSLNACGPGVERLAEDAAALFPKARMALADSDTLSGPLAAADMVGKIENREIDILIGTQIMAKGYHFPHLTLVGAIDADLGLAGGDLRAAERTFQLLYQVAGRSGRSERPGRALLQTYMPDHPVMKALASGSRERFLEMERSAREQALMPPFGRLAAVIVSGHEEAAVDKAAALLARKAPREAGVSVFGPAPAPLALLRGQHRRRLLLKAERNISVQPLIRRWLSEANIPRKIKVRADIDPYSFL